MKIATFLVCRRLVGLCALPNKEKEQNIFLSMKRECFQKFILPQPNKKWPKEWESLCVSEFILYLKFARIQIEYIFFFSLVFALGNISAFIDGEQITVKLMAYHKLCLLFNAGGCEAVVVDLSPRNKTNQKRATSEMYEILSSSNNEWAHNPHFSHSIYNCSQRRVKKTEVQ